MNRSNKHVIISVFGNDADEHDNAAVRLVPGLRKIFPGLEFMMQDPTESLEPAGDPWIILDTAVGLYHVAMVESLDDLEYVKGSSVHDFDVYMELRLRAKLKPLPTLKIILVPQGEDIGHAVAHVSEIIRSISM